MGCGLACVLTVEDDIHAHVVQEGLNLPAQAVHLLVVRGVGVVLWWAHTSPSATCLQCGGLRSCAAAGTWPCTQPLPQRQGAGPAVGPQGKGAWCTWAGWAHHRLMPCDDHPGGDGAVDARQVVQEPGQLRRAQLGLHRRTNDSSEHCENAQEKGTAGEHIPLPQASNARGAWDGRPEPSKCFRR